MIDVYGNAHLASFFDGTQEYDDLGNALKAYQQAVPLFNKNIRKKRRNSKTLIFTIVVAKFILI